MTPALPDARRITRALLATWPAVSATRVGGWTIREGQGGGNRASCATLDGPLGEAEGDADLPAAETAMRRLGQVPLVMVRDDEGALDTLLERHAYAVHDPTRLYAIETGRLVGDGHIPMGGGYAMWPPLHKIREIWEAEGTGSARQAVMDRVPPPKAAFIARTGDHAGGAAFAAIHDGIAMIHALHVVTEKRRRGTARQLLKQVAIWAEGAGAPVTCLAVTRANTPANALYASLGMSRAGGYHYRIKPEER